MNELAPALWAGPLLVFAWLTLLWWTRRPVGENLAASAVVGAFSWSGLMAVGQLIRHVSHSENTRDLGVWFSLPDYQNVWTQAVDPLGLTLAALASGLVAVIAHFSRSYLHREIGYVRFYLLTTLFGGAVLLVALSATVDQLFFGWELVGLSSALLIAFFSHRVGPARSGLRAFLTYRVGDIGLLTAVVILHHATGGTAIDSMTRFGWLGVRAPQGSGVCTLIMLLILLACAGKSALAPFGGWLPRAMEGPTPSSAVFYGALSINLGPFLLLRCWPLLEASPLARLAVFLVGMATVVHGTLVGRVQSDAKSALAYGSMTQVGLIVVEISLGWTWFAVFHMVGHAGLRTLEMLRAPSLLHDYQHLERSLGEVLPRMGLHYERWLPGPMRRWMYRQALERGMFEALLLWAVSAWQGLAGVLDRVDRNLESALCGSDEVKK